MAWVAHNSGRGGVGGRGGHGGIKEKSDDILKSSLSWRFSVLRLSVWMMVSRSLGESFGG